MIQDGGLLNAKVPRADLADGLSSLARRLAERNPSRRAELRLHVDQETWHTLRSDFQRPYKLKPLNEFRIYVDGATVIVERDAPADTFVQQPLEVRSDGVEVGDTSEWPSHMKPLIEQFKKETPRGE